MGPESLTTTVDGISAPFAAEPDFQSACAKPSVKYEVVSRLEIRGMLPG